MENYLCCSVYQSEGSTAAAFGTLVHSCIEDYWRHCLWTKSENAYEEIDAIVNRAFSKPAGVLPGREEEAKNLMWRFAYSHVANLGELWATERTFVAEAHCATLNGTLDRLDRLAGSDDEPTMIRIIDYKTSWGLPEKQWPSFQLMFYAGLIAENMPSIEAFELEVDHVRRSDGIARHTVDAAQVATFWKKTILRLEDALRLRTSGGLPTGGASCVFCRWRRECSEATLDARERLLDSVDAINEADAWVRHTHAQKAREASIRAWVEANGNVLLPGLEIGYIPSSSEDEPMDGNAKFRARKIPLVEVGTVELEGEPE